MSSTPPLSPNAPTLAAEALPHESAESSDLDQRVETAASLSFSSFACWALNSLFGTSRESEPVSSANVPLLDALQPTVREETYDSMRIAARFARLSYKLCDEVRSVEFNEKQWSCRFLNRETGNQIPGKPAVVFQHEQTLFISVPGTISANDWASNIWATLEQFSKTDFILQADNKDLFRERDFEAHCGFLLVAQSVINQIIPLAEADLFQNITEINCTGHSQGGAVAKLIALYLATHKEKLKILPDAKLCCFTFAAPRVFTPDTAHIYMKEVPNTFCMINQLDFVPKVPFGAFGYKHVGSKICIPHSLFTSALYSNVEYDLSQSMDALDLEAAQRLASASLCAANPSRWTKAIGITHSMTYYEDILSSPEGKEIVLATKIAHPDNFVLAHKDPDPSYPFRVRFIRGLHEEDDRVDIEMEGSVAEVARVSSVVSSILPWPFN